MNVNCPSCGLSNTSDEAGQEVVCSGCFHVWTPGSEAEESPPDAPQDAELVSPGDALEPEEPVEMPTVDLGEGPIDLDNADMLEISPEVAASVSPGAQDVDDLLDGTTDLVDGSTVIEAPTSADVGTHAFGRSQRGGLSGEEMDTLGSYTRSGTSVAFAEDVVWDEGEEQGAQPGSPVARDPSIDPLSQTGIAWEAGDLGDSTTSLDTADPSDTSPVSAGSTTNLSESPFDSQVADDGAYEVGHSQAAKGAEDPFADLGTGSDASYEDPFAGSDVIASEDNPFEDDSLEQAPPAPAGDGVMEELDFSALGDEGPGEDAYVTSEAQGVGAADDSGAWEQAGAELDSEEALLELDVPSGDKAPETAGPGSRRRRRGRGRRAGRGGGDKQKKIAMAVVLAVVLIGVGLGQTNLGYFGLNAIMGDSEPDPTVIQTDLQDTQRDRPKGAYTGMSSDAPTDYVKRIAELEVKLKAQPANAAVLQDLVRTLMRLQERHPSVYQGNPVYGQRLDDLLSPEQLRSDRRLLIRKLLVENKPEDAAKALEQFVAELTDDPDDLYLMARVARSQGDIPRAIANYRRAIEKEPKFEPALFDLGRIHMEAQEIPEARQIFANLLKVNPKHSEAKLSMAQIALYEKKYADAEGYVESALVAAKETKNDEAKFQSFWLKSQLAEAQGKTDERGYALERALEIRPTDEKTALALAEFLHRQDRAPEALKRLEACEKAGASSPAFYKALVESYKQSGQTDEAQQKLEEALGQHGEDTGLLMLQAADKTAAKHFKTAKAIYATIVEKDPAFIESYLGLADLLVQENRLTEAIDTLRTGAERADEKLPLLAKMTELQMQAGATLKAKETMGQILKLDPNNTDIKLRFATLLKELGFSEEAARYYEDLDVAGALQTEQTLDYAEVLNQLGRRDMAMRQVESVIATDPMNLRANVLRGAFHTTTGAYKKAAEDLRRALKVDKDSAQAHYHLGLNELAQDRRQEALEYLARASSLAPDNLGIRFDLARGFTAVGGSDNRRAALAQYGHITDIYERYTSPLDKKRIDPEVYLLRGRLFFDDGQYRKALADFKQAMVLDPVRQDLIIEFAKTLQTTGRRTEADAYLKEVLSRDARNPAAHYYLGESALKAGRNKSAEDHLKRAIASGGADFPAAHRHLGYIYKEKGLKALSCNGFKEYLRLAPRTAYDREEIARLVSQTCR